MHTHLTLPRNYEIHILILKTGTQLVCDCHDITFSRPISWMKRCTPTETRTVDTVSSCGINFSSMVQVSWFSLATLKHVSWTTEKQKKERKIVWGCPAHSRLGGFTWLPEDLPVRPPKIISVEAILQESRASHIPRRLDLDKYYKNALLTRKNRVRYGRERSLRNLGKHWKI